MTITPEIAKSDIEQLIGNLANAKPGSRQELAGVTAVSSGSVMAGLLNRPDLISMMYLSIPDAFIPETILNVAREYVAKRITKEEAFDALADAESKYNAVLKSAGLSPRTSEIFKNYAK